MTTAPPRAGAARAIWKHTSPPWRKAQQMQRGRVCIFHIRQSKNSCEDTYRGKPCRKSLIKYAQTNQFYSIIGKYTAHPVSSPRVYGGSIFLVKLLVSLLSKKKTMTGETLELHSDQRKTKRRKRRKGRMRREA